MKKASGSPVKIIELCAARPHTAREMAGRLGLAPTRLYYHINLLEKHGLLVVDETRTVTVALSA